MPVHGGERLLLLDDLHGKHFPSSKTDVSVRVSSVPQQREDEVGMISQNHIALREREREEEGEKRVRERRGWKR